MRTVSDRQRDIALALVGVLAILVAVVLPGLIVPHPKGHLHHVQMRAQLDAGAALVVLFGLLFLVGPKRYVAENAISGNAEKPAVPVAPAQDAVPAVEAQDAVPSTDTEPAKPAVAASSAKPAVPAHPAMPAQAATPAYAVGDRIPAAVFKELTAAQQKLASSRRGLLWQSLYVGLDGRWSTSKFQSLVWTIVFAYTLLTLFIASRYGQTFDGKTFGQLTFPTNYLLLLGGPYATSIGAKAITSAQSDQKTADTTTDKSVAEGVQELVGDDNGDADLGDLQFFVFNIVALVVFLVTFVPDVDSGLPQLPDYLVALTSAASLAYLGKKAFGAQPGTITSVLPGRVRPGATLTITGTGLTAGIKEPIVAIDGVRSGAVAVTAAPKNATDAVTVTAQVSDGVTAGPGKVVAIQPTADVAAVTGTVEVVDTALTVAPSPIPWAPGTAVTTTGADFGTVVDGVIAKLGDKDELSVSAVAPTRIDAALPLALSGPTPPSPTATLVLRLPDGSTRQAAVELVPAQIVLTAVTPDPLGVDPDSAVTIIGIGFGPEPPKDGVSGVVTLGSVVLPWSAWTDATVMAALPTDVTQMANLPRAPASVPLTVARVGRASGAISVRV